MKCTFFIFLLFGFVTFEVRSIAIPIIELRFGNPVYQCKSQASNKHIWLFKIGLQSSSPEKNIESVYQQLEQWMQEKLIQEVITTGCEERRLSGVTQRLKSKFGDQLDLSCGDDSKLAAETQAAFLDAKKIIDFLSRLEQFKLNPARRKPHLAAARESFKLSPSSSLKEVKKRLVHELRYAMARVHDTLDRRNKGALEAIKASHSSNVALLFGGIHTPGIVKGLESAGMGCTVIEPNGYPRGDEDEESKMLQDLILLARAQLGPVR